MYKGGVCVCVGGGGEVDPTLIRPFQSFETTIYFKKQKRLVAVPLSFAQIMMSVLC